MTSRTVKKLTQNDENNIEKNENSTENFREEYERERVKSAYLADRVAQLEDENDDLKFKLDRIK